MLQLKALTKRFGETTAVSAVDLTIPPGQMVGVIGQSGAGKSTLLRMINRLTEPSSGTILFCDRDVTALRGGALRDWRTRCAMIFQQFNLVGRLGVLDNVLMGRLNYHPTLAALCMRFTRAERAFAIEALDRLGMAHAALQRADTLSGGQQQRVAIARALVQEPQILLADEPIASLDPRNARVVMDALKAIHLDGITVVCNLHTLDTARAYCERVVAMYRGEIVFDGAPDELSGDVVRAIYGGAESEELDEAITSTSLITSQSQIRAERRVWH